MGGTKGRPGRFRLSLLMKRWAAPTVEMDVIIQLGDVIVGKNGVEFGNRCAAGYEERW